MAEETDLLTTTAGSRLTAEARESNEQGAAAAVGQTDLRPERLHALDAVRAFALLLGVVLHSALAYVLPPGQWGVGTETPNLALWGFVHYVHSFRMELFLLLAGFFGASVVARRGLPAYWHDRVLRIGLVFAFLMYPIKFLVSMPWIAGGLKTGWLSMPPDVARLPIWTLALGGFRNEVFPEISPAHLWFLYYLFLVTTLFVALRWVLQRRPLASVADALHRIATLGVGALAHPLGPLLLAIPLMPLLATTPRGVLESSDRGFVPDVTAVAIYGYMFCAGWALYRRPDVLRAFGRHWGWWLVLSLAAGAAGFWLDVQRALSGILVQPWPATLPNALTLAFATLGWIGFFIDRFNAPRPWVRYLADASYWIYVIHLPIVVALQVWVSDWASLPLQLLVVNAVTFGVSLLTYDLLVRDTPLGSWLNGRRRPRWLRRRAPTPG